MERRTFLLAALTGTAALALGSYLYLPELEGIDTDQDHRVLLSVLLPVFLDGALPEVEGPRLQALNRTQEAIAASMAVLPSHQQQELQHLFGLLEAQLGLLLLTGSLTPLMLRSPSELIQMLERWRTSYVDLLVTAYQGLRELVMASFYACPEHWARLHYAKPRLFDGAQ
ncbi:TAT leader-containing periplasmic protein [Shewanella salipaludis]|uniref:TAT leader-containing periplasmic protein n=1 Tax=Shewanella salipaludis TaxID=2723052 RepID=A0A972FY17_9GAMM|nr:TAT leader-containing periplasmic protein [Shewanella salipaludis]NMH65338.1 TAT leader-containing periplasmic protein [Shewanella salipaludis]